MGVLCQGGFGEMVKTEVKLHVLKSKWKIMKLRCVEKNKINSFLLMCWKKQVSHWKNKGQESEEILVVRLSLWES